VFVFHSELYVPIATYIAPVPEQDSFG
jgi:hypothetical protein